MNIAKSSAKLFASRAARALFLFIGTTYFARQLGASEIGVFFLFQALVRLLSVIADFGLRGAIEKRMSEGRHAPTILSAGVSLKLAPLSIVAAAVWLLRGFVNEYLGADLAPLLLVAVVLYESSRLSIDVLRGRMRAGETASLEVLEQATWLLTGAALLELGFGVRALVYALLVGYAMMTLGGLYKQPPRVARPSMSMMRSIADYAKYHSVNIAGGYVYSWMDLAIIGLFLTQADVGAYEVAWRISLFATILSTSIGVAIFPQMSAWDTSGAIDRIESLIPTAMVFSALFVIPAFVAMPVLSADILRVLFGQEYTIASAALIVLMSQKVISAIGTTITKALNAIDRPNLRARATVGSLLTNVVLNVVLVLQFGLLGAAVATTIAAAINTGIQVYYLSRFVTIDFPYYDVGWLAFSSLCMAAIIFGIKSIYTVNAIVGLAGIVLVGGATYTAFVFVSPRLRFRLRLTIDRLLA
ncbi:polysaccharide biosynthesis protein [Halobacteriales archaeon QS_3_64_16]|nr:MAG: polysaccharide biosynthesis protein [Halobacteriales archaeon QS_3_64_16]